MKDEQKTKEQLIDELQLLRQRITKLETSATDSKQAERIKNMLKIATEQCIEGIAVVDLYGYILLVNHAWAQMHGYSKDELQGKHLSIFHNEEQLQKEVIPTNGQVKKSGMYQGEIGHVRKDGTILPTIMSNTLLMDDGGKPIGLIGTAVDITEQKQPIYDFKCHSCGEVSELLVPSSEDIETLTCPSCGRRNLERLLSVPSLLKESANASGTTCCGREERCETPPCSTGKH